MAKLKHFQTSNKNVNNEKALRDANTARAGCSDTARPPVTTPTDRTDYNTLRR